MREGGWEDINLYLIYILFMMNLEKRKCKQGWVDVKKTLKNEISHCGFIMD
jgi:hypothetical protein